MILYIKQAGCEILHKGKILRTPVKLNIKKTDITRYIKMMKFKSIYRYEIIENEEKHKIIHSVIPHRSSKKSDDMIQTNKLKEDVSDKHIYKTRVVQRATPLKKITQNNDFHESIESDIDLNIDIDVDSDDILKQLLLNI